MPENSRESVVTQALFASKLLANQLDLLLDGFDFYVNRYGFDSPSEMFKFEEALYSVTEFEGLFKTLKEEIEIWQMGRESGMRPADFELNVLNEIFLHMTSCHQFISEKGIEVEGLMIKEVDRLIEILKTVSWILDAEART